MKVRRRLVSAAIAASLWQVSAYAADGASVPAGEARNAAVEQVLSSMTLEEKVDLIGGTGFATRAIPRVGLPPFKMSDGPVGARSPAPSTAYAAGIGLAATWDTALAEEIGKTKDRAAILEL